MNYAIVGCGLIGKKRLAGLPAGSKLVVACDTTLARAEELVKLAKTGHAVADFKQARRRSTGECSDRGDHQFRAGRGCRRRHPRGQTRHR